MAYGKGLLAREHGRAGVTLALSVAPHLVITGKVELDLTLLQFGLLQAEYGKGLLAREHGRAGVTLALSVAPHLVITGKVELDLTLLQFGLLQAEDVGVEFGHVVGEVPE